MSTGQLSLKDREVVRFPFLKERGLYDENLLAELCFFEKTCDFLLSLGLLLLLLRLYLGIGA